MKNKNELLLAKPTRPQAAAKAAQLIGIYANYHGQLKPTYVLQDPPLMMNSMQLTKLALALRAYVQLYDNTATIVASDIKKSGMTVADVTNLVFKKLKI